MVGIYRNFRDASWSGAYGGKNWMKIARCQVMLFDLASDECRRAFSTDNQYKIKNDTDGYFSQGNRMNSIIDLLNTVVNMGHNTGWIFNKFVDRTLFDHASAGTLDFAMTSGNYLALHREFLNVGLRQMLEDNPIDMQSNQVASVLVDLAKTRLNKRTLLPVWSEKRNAFGFYDHKHTYTLDMDDPAENDGGAVTCQTSAEIRTWQEYMAADSKSIESADIFHKLEYSINSAANLEKEEELAGKYASIPDSFVTSNQSPLSYLTNLTIISTEPYAHFQHQYMENKIEEGFKPYLISNGPDQERNTKNNKAKEFLPLLVTACIKPSGGIHFQISEGHEGKMTGSYITHDMSLSNSLDIWKPTDDAVIDSGGDLKKYFSATYDSTNKYTHHDMLADLITFTSKSKTIAAQQIMLLNSGEKLYLPTLMQKYFTHGLVVGSMANSATPYLLMGAFRTNTGTIYLAPVTLDKNNKVKLTTRHGWMRFYSASKHMGTKYMHAKLNAVLNTHPTTPTAGSDVWLEHMFGEVELEIQSNQGLLIHAHNQTINLGKGPNDAS
jgi:hypothetical protein